MKCPSSIRRSPGGLLLAVMLVGGCSSPDGGLDLGSPDNPFADPGPGGKEDTGYVNSAGVEVEVTLEADVAAPSYRIFDAPANLAQYAVTYLRKRKQFYLELLAEDAAAPDRVEWLVGGEWITASAAHSVAVAELTHFRITHVNAVLLGAVANGVAAGDTHTAKVPARPYSVYSDAGTSCADSNAHIPADQGVYWYLWNPSRNGCHVDQNDLTVTIERLLPQNPPSYPEYDRLQEDGQLTAVVLFGKLDDGNVEDDYNWAGADRFCRWLEDAGFTEASDPPRGRRYTKQSGALETVVDVYYPDLFHSVTDYGHFQNWQAAVSEHEVVIYLGHSVLGTGSAFDDVQYPDFYQVFVIGGCLGYEYYVRPVLAGKGGWENVDAVSSIVENGYSELNGIAGAILSKLVFGFEHDGLQSWQEILAALTQRLGHSHFGVSGARDNCFTPGGNACNEPPPDPTVRHYENATAFPIPDNDPTGVTSTIEVPDDLRVGSLEVALDVSHTWIGDLKIDLSHGGTVRTLWNRSGGSGHDIRVTVPVGEFDGAQASGTWTLTVDDDYAQDTGVLNRWALDIRPAL